MPGGNKAPNVGGGQEAIQNDPQVENNVTDAEVEKKLETLYAKRGKKTYDVVIADIGKEGIKNAAQGYAIDAIEQWDKEENPLSKIKNPAARIALSLPLNVANTFKRTVRLYKYDQIAKSIGEEMNSLDAVSLAMEEMQKIKKTSQIKKNNIADIVANRLNEKGGARGIDESIRERVMEARDAGEDNIDTGVAKKTDDFRQDALYDIFAEYAREVATYKGGAKTKAVKEAREEADALISEVDKKGTIANYDEVFAKINKDLKGAFAEELGKKAEKHDHDVAIAAIDKYIEDNLNVFEADVKTGLDVKEVKYVSAGDRSTLQHGIVTGLAVALGTSLVVNVAKSTAIKAVTNSNVVGAIAKVVAAGTIGAIAGRNKKEREQRRGNIKDALSGESKESDGKTFEIVNISEKIDELNKLVDAGFNSQEEYDNASMIIADLRARNKIQNEKHIQLLGFNGRDDVEKSKLEMFKALNKAQKAMKGSDFNKNDELESMMTRKLTDLYVKTGDVEKSQRKERVAAALKTAVISAATAAISVAAFDMISGLAHGDGLLGGKLFSEIKGFANHELKLDGLHVVATGAGAESLEAVANSAENVEVDTGAGEHLDKGSGAVLINDDPAGGVEVGLDKDGDGVIDTYLFGEGEQPGIDLSDESQIAELNESLNQYGIELQHEQIISSEYGQVSIEDYINNAENSVEVGPVDWSQSGTRVVFGNPVAVAADGMDQYEVNIAAINGGEIPDGAKFFIDLDGDGPGRALEYTIQDGKAIIPADVLDTSRVGTGGVANFIGVARVGEVNAEGNMISYATSFGKTANLSDTLMASVDNDVHAFTAIDVETGERLSQFAVNPESAEISNMSEIFNGIEVSGHDRLPSVFTVNDLGDNAEPVTLASGEVLQDYDVSGGYHPEFDAFENTAFKGSDTFLGTPMTWDADMDGVMSPAEELSYIKQLIVRTGTNPYMLGQNASNYGILEPETLENIIPREKLVEWGITDGVVDSEVELNLMLAAIKQPANAEYWDRLANATINEMESKLSNGGFDVERIANRTATYSNSFGLFDTSGATTQRTILYPYTINESGEKVAIGNVGWWCRKYGAYGGRVGDLPLCEQKGIPRGSEASESSEGIENTGSENSETTETSEAVEDTGSENSETTETSEAVEDTGSENSETTETSEGVEDTGSEGTEGSEDSETSEGVEDTGSEGTEGSEGNEDIKNAAAIEQNMGVHDETTNILDQRGVTEQTEIPTFAPEGVNVDTTNAADNAAQEAADAAAREVGETPIYTNEELGQLYEQFRANHNQ